MNFFTQELSSIKKKGLYRTLKTVTSEQSTWVTVDEKKILLLSSNNYLGLASHPAIKKAVSEAAQEYGCGAGASRLISGNSDLYTTLEEKIAHFTIAECAVVFSSGYMANMGIISALCKREDTIFCDKLNHASIIDGCRISKANLKRYPHKNMTALERMLQSASQKTKKIIISDAIFSMDGDVVPLPEILNMAKRFDALVIIDEAHAIGVLGETGKGIKEYFNVKSDDSLITMGTFGKAFGSFGAYATGTREVIDFFINKSRNLIFTTALPPPVLAASLAAIDIVENFPELRRALLANANYLRTGLSDLGFNTGDSTTQIIPILTGDPLLTMRIAEDLFDNGVFIQGIRPPSVPHGTSRLRVTVMATHTRSDLDFALGAFTKTGKKYGII